MPKARLRGEKSLAFDGPNHSWRVLQPQEIVCTDSVLLAPV